MPGYEIFDKKEKIAINKLFTKNVVLSRLGQKKRRKHFHILEFEKNVCNLTKSKYALAVSSGTAAIKIALKSLGIKPGDEVITQAFNFVATIEAILDIGAKPVIVGIDDSLNIDVNDLKKKITKKTKIIIPVHMLGVGCDMKNLIRLAKKHGIKILEDNCEAFGAKYKNKYLGTLGDAGIISLDFGKVITTGEGGIILTNSKKIYDLSKQYHDHGHKNIKNIPRGLDKSDFAGFNYRMTEMQGVIGKVQLSKLKKIISLNRARYRELYKILSNKVIIRKNFKGHIGIFDTFIFRLKNKIEIKKVIKLLSEKGIGTKNIPDALRWHCSFYWKYMLSDANIKNSKNSSSLLNQHVAIPILIKRSKSFYKLLGSDIKKLLN